MGIGLIYVASTLHIEGVSGVRHVSCQTPTPRLQLLPFCQIIVGVYVYGICISTVFGIRVCVSQGLIPESIARVP